MNEGLDIELFVGEIKKYPEIWDISSELYHDRTKKRTAWINICQIFSEGFEDKEDKDKNEICNAMVKKWRNLKDTFTKSLKKSKSGSAGGRGRRYLYARQLSFLRPAILSSQTQSSLPDHPEGDEDEASGGIRAEWEQGPSSSAKRPSVSNSSNKRKRDLESSLIEFINRPSPSLPTNAPSAPNPHQAFFASLMPILDGFTEEETVDFRLEVLTIVKRMQNARRFLAQPVRPSNRDPLEYSCTSYQNPPPHQFQPHHSAVSSPFHPHHPPNAIYISPASYPELSTHQPTNSQQPYDSNDGSKQGRLCKDEKVSPATTPLSVSDPEEDDCLNIFVTQV